MNKDFRVAVSLPTHPKSIKLMRRCGDRSFYCLIRLWAYVALNRPDGDLTGLDIDDIEIAADWNGQCSEFYQALLDFRFLDKTDDGLFVHDWEDHNGYAAHAEDRSMKARKAAFAKWERQNKCNEHEVSNAPSIVEQCPLPSPYPSPIPDLEDTSETGVPYQQILDLYHTTLPELPATRVMTSKRKAAIKARWNSRFSLNDGTRSDSIEFWERYFGYIRESKFLMGMVPPNNGHKQFVSNLEWLTNESNFAKVIEGSYHD